MIITGIKLRNFKGFVSQDVVFLNLNIFTGLNAMGKSSFIQSLLLLRQSYLLGKLNEKGGLLLNGELTSVGIGKDIFAMEAEGDSIDIEVNFGAGNYASYKFNYEQQSDLQSLANKKSEGNIDTFSLFTDQFQYLHAERLSPERDLFPASTSSIKKGNLGKNGQYTVHYIAENQRKSITISELKHPSSKTDILLENIEGWLGEISPGVRITAVFFPELNSSKLSYKFTVGDAVSEEFKPSNVGFGLTYVLPVITSILMAKPGDVVVIENPESHIHPTGQSALARLFAIAAQKGVQVILETHSDHIINGILIAIKPQATSTGSIIDNKNVAVYFVERELNLYKSIVKLIKIRDDGRIIDAPKNFFDQFTKDMKTIMGF